MVVRVVAVLVADQVLSNGVREREVYPNAPIVLTAVEIRHSLCEPLERREVSRISALLAEVLPLRGELKGVSIAVQAGPEGQSAQQTALAPIPRWTSRDKRTAVTLRQDALVIETTLYGSYERLRRVLELALRARDEVSPPAGVERIGLRYIDEIRVPADNGGARITWREWIDSTLLGPAHVGDELGLIATASKGLTVFAGADDHALVLRYGPQDNPAVASTPQLRRPTPPPGPLFVLDIDSFWQSDGEVPEMTAATVLGIVDRLHLPVREMFESLITDRLRQEVLRNG